MKKNWKKESISFFGSPLFKYTFENGLRLFVRENKVAPVFSYQTWFDVGSRDEEKNKSGLAHFFEHLMFKGTKNQLPGTFDRAMESSGARDLNAFTGTDYTAYVASLPVESLEMVAKLESDRMVGLLLTQEQFESEREVVRNERKQRTENNPEGKMYEELLKLAFQSHAYGRPVIGIEEDLDAMTTDDCYEFYRNFYAPNNAVICVVGDVKPDRVASIVGKYYGKIPGSPARRPQYVAEPEQKEEKVNVMQLAVQVEKAYVAYKIPDAKHPDQVPLSVLSTILSTGRSSKFYRALVDKGITMDASGGPNASKDPALFYVSFTCQAGKKAHEALDVIDRVFADLEKNGITDEELKRAKNKVRTEIHLGLVNNSSIANFIGQNEILLGDMRHAIEEVEQIQRVKAEDVQSVVKKYLQKGQRTVVIGKPE